MKYLDGYPELDLLSKALSFSSPSLRVSTRIEAYSCKPIARERKLFKAIEHDLLDNLSLSASISPPEHHSDLVSSAFGPLDRKDSRKTLWLLITTLNIAFPDHDFSTLSAEEFVREDSPRIVLASVTSALHHLRSSSGQDEAPAMPLNLGMGMPSVLDSYHKSYSSSAPVRHSAVTTHRKAIEQKTQPKPGAMEQDERQTKAQQAKAGNSTDGQSSKTGEIAKTTDDASKASQHQPRSKSKLTNKGHHSVSIAPTSTTKKKQQSPISHTTLISKLRNELDGTYEVPAHPLLRQVLDPIIDLSECDVYSYTPDLDSDPHAYQSEDEEEDEDDDEEEEDYERQSDGLDMDLEDENEPYRPAGMIRMNDDDAVMVWEMDGAEATAAKTLPGAPADGTQPHQQSSSSVSEGQAVPSGGVSPSHGQGRTPAQRKRASAGAPNAGDGKRQPRGGPEPATLSSWRTAAPAPGTSIFADPQRRHIPFQYGSLDEYSYNHHQASHLEQQVHQEERESSSRRSPFLDGMSSNEHTDDDEEDDEDTDNGGLLWSSNYFFYNRKMKRILFVSVWGRKIGKQFSPSNAILGRSAGNPLHAYKRQLHSSFRASSSKPGRDGTVTINLNRPRAGSNPATHPTRPSSGEANENNPDQGGSHVQYSGKNTSSNLSNALRANADSTILNTSFSSQPPIANAASIFRPSSPFPRADNRFAVTPSTPSSYNAYRSSTGGSDDPQPPAVRDSGSNSPRMGTPLHSPSMTSSANADRNLASSTRSAMKRGQCSSGTNTPSRKTSKRTSARRRVAPKKKGSVTSSSATASANTG